MKIYAVVIITLAVNLAVLVSANAQTAAELIEQAHKYDNMYSLGPQTSQQKAVSLYQSALEAGPDDQQRLHILCGMARLYGSGYQVQKGEKPDFHKAIEFYKQIIDCCPPDEPLVFQAMISIGDHYTSLYQFETALQWFKKPLDYNTPELEGRFKAIEQRKRELLLGRGRRQTLGMTQEELLEFKDQLKRAHSLKQAAEHIKRYQEVAVDQVAYSAGLIDPLRAHGELLAIIEQHPDSFIADRAIERLWENMESMPEVWLPTDEPPCSPANSSLQACGSPPGATNQTDPGIKTTSVTPLEPTQSPGTLEPNTVERPKEHKYSAKQTRAPPPGRFQAPLIGAAGLVILALAAVIILISKNSILRN